MKKKILIGILVAAIVIYAAFVIIKNRQNSKNGEDQNSQRSFRIVTSFYPMYIATLNIANGIDNVSIQNLTTPTTGCLHDYQISPAEMIKLKTADAFVINGAGMENFLDKAVSTYPDLKIINSSENIELLKDKNGVENPHLWVSISQYIKQIENIAKGLETLDPDNAEKYNVNAQTYIDKLNKEKQKMHEGLKNITQKNIVTFHEAFDYFAQEFGLNIVAVVEREPGTEPSPDEIVETVDTVKKSNTKALFAEPQYSKNAAEVIAKETDAKVYMLDPAVTGSYSKDSYLNIMDKNLEVLQEALK